MKRRRETTESGMKVEEMGAKTLSSQFAASLRLHRGKAAALPCAFSPSAAHFRFNPSRLRKSAAEEASENYKYENNLI